MSLPALPIFVRLAGRPVMLIGEGEAADAKRRLLERAGGVIVGEGGDARLAIVALSDPDATVARLRARGVLVNAVDRPDLCDFTLPAIVDRAPVLVAVGTGGVSAGLAAALRQRLETVLPATLGSLAEALDAARPRLRALWPDAGERRRQIGGALGGRLDPLVSHHPAEVEAWLRDPEAIAPAALLHFALSSPDPEDLTLRQARALAQADRVYHQPDVPAAILDRARADAARVVCDGLPNDPGTGNTVYLEMRR